MSGQGGMMMGLPVERGHFDPEPIRGGGRGELVGGPFDKPIFGGGGTGGFHPIERGNPIDQPIPFPMMKNFPEQDPAPYPMIDPGFGQFQPGGPGDFNPGDGGGKGGFPPPSVGIDPSPIQGGGGGGGSNGPGLDHLKDYGPVVDQMKQYVQSMSGLIDQINSKF